MNHHNVARWALASSSILVASACFVEPSDDPPAPAPVRARHVRAPAAPLGEGRVLDRFLAGEAIEQPLTFVGDSAFVRLAVDGDAVYAELRPGYADLSIERLTLAKTARVQLVGIDTGLDDQTLTGRAMLDFLVNRPGKLQGGRARVTPDPSRDGASDPVHEVTVIFLDSL